MNHRTIIFMLFVLSQFGITASSQDKPFLSVKKALDDSVLTIHYKVPATMFLELSIFNRQGFIVDIPLAKQLGVSEDSIRVRVANYLTGTYFVRCKVNQVAIPIMKMFRHEQKGQHVTYSSEEIALHNKLPACDQTLCPVGALSDYDDFLKKYPNYIDKGEVFQRALLAYVKLDQDSVLISRTIDSLVTYVPSFYTYYSISRYLTENHKLASLGTTYFVKAGNTLASIPESLQHEYSSKLSEIEKQQR